MIRLSLSVSFPLTSDFRAVRLLSRFGPAHCSHSKELKKKEKDELYDHQKMKRQHVLPPLCATNEVICTVPCTSLREGFCWEEWNPKKLRRVINKFPEQPYYVTILSETRMIYCSRKWALIHLQTLKTSLWCIHPDQKRHRSRKAPWENLFSSFRVASCRASKPVKAFLGIKVARLWKTATFARVSEVVL